jgi:hypothetical protein
MTPKVPDIYNNEISLEFQHKLIRGREPGKRTPVFPHINPAEDE